MKTIIKKLAITPEEYEEIIWLVYRNWCEGVTTNTKEFQQVLSNSSINAWFRIELSKCETEFLNLTRHYDDSNVTAKDFNNCFNQCLLSLFNIRPMALLKKIVKPKVRGVAAFSELHIN